MNTRIGFIFLSALISLECNHHEEITLEKVSDLPEYFSEAYHFGKDIRSIEELNDFLLVTGRIDTTSESPPLRLAVIVVGHTKVFLNFRKAQVNHDEITERYSGNGYDLILVYKEKHIRNHSPIYEGYFVIRRDNNKSQYEVVGTSGYN
jgi:hypothetical protein